MSALRASAELGRGRVFNPDMGGECPKMRAGRQRMKILEAAIPRLDEPEQARYPYQC